jgi:hypothetical protein
VKSLVDLRVAENVSGFEKITFDFFEQDKLFVVFSIPDKKNFRRLTVTVVGYRLFSSPGGGTQKSLWQN